MILRFSQKLSARLKVRPFHLATNRAHPVRLHVQPLGNGLDERVDPHGKLLLADEETSPFDLGFRLNDTLLSAVESDEQLDYGKPRAAFRALVARSTAP